MKSESNKWHHGRTVTVHIKLYHRMVSFRPVGCNLVDSPFSQQTIIIIVTSRRNFAAQAHPCGIEAQEIEAQDGIFCPVQALPWQCIPLDCLDR